MSSINIKDNKKDDNVETINELFTGERADKAIYMARKMATGQYLTLWNQKPDNRK